MAESIMNRYQLHSKELSYEEMINDTLSFLHTKAHLFDPSLGKKGFSYYGTIIKNRMLSLRIKESKEVGKKENYDVILPTIIENEKYSYTIDEEPDFSTDFFVEFATFLDATISSQETAKKFKPNELKVGNAIVQVMKNWESFFEDGGSKYNKNQIYECLRSLTNLSTKDIRSNMKKFKLLYFKKKQERLIKNSDGDYTPSKNKSELPNKKLKS